MNKVIINCMGEQTVKCYHDSNWFFLRRRVLNAGNINDVLTRQSPNALEKQLYRTKLNLKFN